MHHFLGSIIILSEKVPTQQGCPLIGVPLYTRIHNSSVLKP